MATTAEIIEEIEALGFKYKMVDKFSIDKLSPERRIQVREVKNYAPKDMVEKYVHLMDNNQFPAIVVTEDGWLGDGNTRVGARIARGELSCQAIVLAVKWEGASDHERNLLVILASTLNSSNGLPLTTRETRMAVRAFIREGKKSEEIGRSLGVKETVVRQVKREMEATDKLAKSGRTPESVGNNGGLSDTALRALGTAKIVDSLNDVPFRDLAALTVDAGLKVNEIGLLAEEIRTIGSDKAAIERLAELREGEYKERIGNHGTPNRSGQLRMRLGFINGYEDTPQDFVEANSALVENHIDAIERSIAILTRVLKMQTSEF